VSNNCKQSITIWFFFTINITINILLTLFLSLVEPTNGKIVLQRQTAHCFVSKDLVQKPSFPVTVASQAKQANKRRFTCIACAGGVLASSLAGARRLPRTDLRCCRLYYLEYHGRVQKLGQGRRSQVVRAAVGAVQRLVVGRQCFLDRLVVAGEYLEYTQLRETPFDTQHRSLHVVRYLNNVTIR